ncbi:hypothetical protein [Candidatus Scalindua japonica]|nr:hypothetical protein [Candidatus Scalindua japonica]
MSDADVRRLAHELQAHQIELEMRHEDLKKSQKTLEELRSRYSDIFNH